jgi:site-specific DNA-methyltransferase (adenine-specific)
MQIVKINEVKPNPKNPRIIKDDKFKKLVKSIQDFPDMLNKRPLIVFTDVDGKYVVLGGNMRLKACKEIGLKEIPVILADEWTEEQKAEFLIKDNVGFGEWDWDSLANEWEVDKLEEWGLDLPVDLSVQEELEAEEDEFDVPEGGIETDIVLGDLFEIGEHRLLCGDSTDSDQVAKLMNGQKADMVFTDPPYGVDYEGGALTKRTKLDNDQKNTNIYQEVLPNIILFTKDKAPMYIWHAAGYADMASHLWDNGIEIRSQIIWNKNIAQFGALSAQYKQKHEPCFYCFKKGNSPYWYGPTNEVTVWDVNRESKNEFHPTQKPIELPTRALNNSSKKGDYILDFFLGSGSTMVASHQLKRKCYGMELDPKYCQVIVDRMKKLDPSLVIKKNGVELK